MAKTGTGHRLVTHPDGYREIVIESGEGVHNLQSAESDAVKKCFRCREPIGIGRRFHLVNGEPVHLEPCCRVF